MTPGADSRSGNDHRFAPGPSQYPILDLIRDDVLYLFGRGHDPEKAADLVYDTIEAHGVTEADLNALVAAFTISADPFGDLAAEGIDLRSNVGWANEFLAALIAIHTDPEREPDDPERRERDPTDPSLDGEAGPAGIEAA